MHIIIYDTRDGDIKRNVECPPDSAQAQCEEHEAWLEHPEVDDSANRLDLTTLTVVPL